MTRRHPASIILSATFLLSAAPTLGSGPAAEFPYDCERIDCSDVLPGVERFERVPDQRYWRGLDSDGEVVGWAAVSTEIVDIKGYSGQPLVTLVGLDPEGLIRGVRILEHSEPILLVGIPEEDLTAFTEKYVGLHATTEVSVGGASRDPDAVIIDAISGATVTVLAEDRTIMETARQLGVAAGVLEGGAAVPGRFIRGETPWTWSKLVRSKALGRLHVSQKEAGEGAYLYGSSDDPDEPFIDLYFTIADAPHVGRALLGDREYEWALAQLEEGEHIFAIFGRGISSFRGSGFVRGGIFDRIRLEQGLSTVMFTDHDYHRVRTARAEGAPDFQEAAWFRVPAGSIDPGMRYELIFLASHFSGEGGFDRTFKSFPADHRLPKSVYRLDGPDPEQEIWRGAWRATPERTVVLLIVLLTVIAFFSARRWTTAKLSRLKKIHIGTQIVAVLVLGIWLRAQPSVTQVLTFFDSLIHEWRWGLFLSDPLLVVSWVFIAVVTIAWGRGVFCGWTCPYGALNELVFLGAQKLGLPSYELPDRIHNKLRWLRYWIFAALLVTFLVSSPLGERMAEVEPFKSTFFVPFWTRHWGFGLWWVVLIVASVFVYRPFCRYVCPLGAALAVPGSARISGPYRHDDYCDRCKICTHGCEPRAIRDNGTIDPRECLSCMECEANYRNDQLCPALAIVRKAREAGGTGSAGAPPKRTGEKAGAAVVALLAFSLLGGPSVVTARTWDVGPETADLQQVLDGTGDGDVVRLREGEWRGRFAVRRSIRLIGENASLDGEDRGTVLTVDAPGVIVEGLAIRGSGDDLGGPDCGIYVTPRGARSVVRNLEIEDCAFGIWVHETAHVEVTENRIVGRGDIHPSNRGNGIHLFDSDSLLVADNRIRSARDGIYISATENSRFERNVVEDQRFGIHYMFSNHNSLTDNVSRNNNSALALMQSTDLLVTGNHAEGSKEHGILFRDAQRCVIRDNVVIDNAEGLFFYSSTENEIVNNRIEANVVGAKIWAGSVRNVVRDNLFVGNRRQIFYVASSDLEVGDSGRGNHWSDYLGWDQDGDGIGDRPYRVDSFTANLLYRFPVAAVLLRSPALELLSHLQVQLPFLRVPTVVDPFPLLEETG